MISTKLSDNVYEYVINSGAVTEEQVFRFFSKESESSLRFQLSSLVKNHTVLKEGNVYLTKDFSKNEAIIKSTVKAGWAIANLGEDNVTQFWRLDYPRQFLVVTSDNRLIDYTVIERKDETKTVPFLLRGIIDKELAGGQYEDIASHVAVLDSTEFADAIRQFNIFDSFCVISEEGGQVKYYKLARDK